LGGVADEGAGRGGGEERHGIQVDAHGGRWSVGERAQRGGEDVEVGHVDLAVDVEGVRGAAEREALSLEPVGVAGDGQVEVLDARAVAVAMRDGPAVALPAARELLEELPDYHLAYAVHADLCRRLGKNKDALASYRKALALARQEPERRFLERRIEGLS